MTPLLITNNIPETVYYEIVDEVGNVRSGTLTEGGSTVVVEDGETGKAWSEKQEAVEEVVDSFRGEIIGGFLNEVYVGPIGTATGNIEGIWYVGSRAKELK